MTIFARMLFCAALTAALLLATPAQAQLSTWWNTCSDGNAAPDERIRACTSIVQSKQETQRNRAIAYNGRGIASANKGELDRAITDYSEAIRLDPKYASAYNNRCWARASFNRELPQALADCDESLRLRPGNANTLDSRGFVYLRLGRLDDAIRDYDAALQTNPKQAASLYGRGIAKLRKGDRTGGNADIAAARAIKPDIAEEFARYGVKPPAG